MYAQYLPTSKICFRSYRYAGFKQYTWWIHNPLGKGVRKVIPFVVYGP